MLCRQVIRFIFCFICDVLGHFYVMPRILGECVCVMSKYTLYINCNEPKCVLSNLDTPEVLRFIDSMMKYPFSCFKCVSLKSEENYVDLRKFFMTFKENPQISSESPAQFPAV